MTNDFPVVSADSDHGYFLATFGLRFLAILAYVNRVG
jgi:hypothetical protein